MAIDLRLPDSKYLFISVEPNSPRTYLIERRLKDLEKASINRHSFHQSLKKRLSGGELIAVVKWPDERVLKFDFAVTDEFGEKTIPSLIVQLTGRSSNLFLLDTNGFIVGSIRETSGDGQLTAQKYHPPERPESVAKQTSLESIEVVSDNGSFSRSLDEFYLKKEADQQFKIRADAARKKLRGELSKRQKLVTKLESDLAAHGNAERWKHFGDLILANLATAKLSNGRVSVTDFFDENLPVIEIDADENDSLTQTAEKYFRRYTRARNAAAEIAKRLETVNAEIDKLEDELADLENAIAEGNETAIAGDGTQSALPGANKRQQKPAFAGARQFRSTDGFDILVGKRAADNDHLTFRIAGPNDLWLHAADYPGSHVVVRNPNRQDIPQRTLLEAAQLAAFYSSGKSQPKAAVNYTQRKYVHKPRRSAPGLVNLASFKTVLVEPRVPFEE
jgi:predicted ribosome quality control (RQC) complex YloA/Tae2 family protein